MINQDLLKILACPETKEPLEMASPELVARINEQIARGQVKNRGQVTVTDKIDQGLIRQNDRKYLYPIRHDIPVLLIEEAIPLEGI